MRLVWKQLPLASNSPTAQRALKRSSNNLAVVGNKAYVYGGEAKPREPVDDELWVVDLDTGDVQPAPTILRPSARVGSALTASGPKLFLWGGRESKEMTACNADLWVYDTAAAEPGWECRAVTEDNKDKDVDGEGGCKSVEERSYHAMAVSGERLYVHAGCPAVGRSANLDSLPITLNTALEWRNHPTAPGPGRGGTVLCPLTLDDKEVLVRYGGFAGHELGFQLDVFHVDTNEWTSIGMPNREGEEGHPLARSVHALVPVSPPVQIAGEQEKKILALMLFGERGPAPAHLGHAGAGQFHQDAWALMRLDDLVSKENPFGLGFEELEQTGEGDAEKVPLARGWFAAGWSEVDGRGGKVVVHGGLNDKNERLGDCWVGRIEV